MILSLAGAAAGVFLLSAASRWRPGEIPPNIKLSVIIPARDEARRLPRLLASLQDPAYAPFEVIVVDDHSTDDTAGLAQAAGARVIPAPPLPEGWTGKAWACMTGARAARGTHFLFLDADTWFLPGGLARFVAEAKREPGAFSVQPYHETRTAAEQLSAFFNVIQLMATGAFRPWHSRRNSGLFGACLWIDRFTYEDVGGHEAVKGHILENVMLSPHLHRHGGRTRARSGSGVLAFRMYSDSRELSAGWRKAFAGGASQTPWPVLLLIILWLSGACHAAIRLLAAPFSPATLTTAAALYALQAAVIYSHLRIAGRFRFETALFYPIVLAFFLFIFGASIIDRLRKRPAQWRGRRIFSPN